MGYWVTLGAATSRHALERALREACDEVSIEPIAGEQLLRPGFEASGRVFVALRLKGPVATDATGIGLDSGLVSRRSTPTRQLRRMVRRATNEFGAIQLFILRVEGGAGAPRELQPVPRRCQSATLVGFLRSGRVVQADTLLSITLHA